MLRTLTKALRLNMTTAARVMLQDYALVRGGAGLFTKCNGRWGLGESGFYASPSVSPPEHKWLRDLAERWLGELGESHWSSRVDCFLPWLPPTSGATLAYSYLSSGLVPGIGPVLARRIVEKLGDNALEMVREKPERLIDVSGIGRRKMASSAAAFRNSTKLRGLAAVGSSGEWAFVLMEMLETPSV